VADPPEIDGVFRIAGIEIYLSCSGGPGTTVVFEAAVGEDHTNWLPIAERLRDRAFVCTYDRAGVGRSTKPKPALGARAHAAQLHELLEVAGVPRPIILVGHSYGGLVAMIEAAEHPVDLAGLVLVDSSHPGQDERMKSVLTSSQVKVMNEYIDQLAEVADFHASLQEASAVYGSLPAIPLTVITAMKVERFDDDPPDYPYEALKAGWLDMQAEHARLRPDARHVKADAGHYIHQDAPDLVVDEILRMVDALEGPPP
jgi:pimeloyl-ACP methyl ester carboxylesterase